MKEPLWRHPALRAAVRASCSGEQLFPGGVSGISIDSRTLAPGDLFVALKGDPGPRFQATAPTDGDGHEYVAMAAKRGASAALVHRLQQVPLPQYLVANTLDALWDLARAARSRTSGQVVALTGSSGKTTLKHFLAATLQPNHSSSGSLNNFWGVPLSLARMPADCPLGIFELGMNHPGEIAPLAELAAPHVAIVLNILPVHMGNFPNLAGIAREKFSISKGLKQDGVLILPDQFSTHANRHWHGSSILFGMSSKAHVRLLDAGAGPDFKVRIGARQIPCRLSCGGGLYQETATAVLACALALGRDPAATADALADLPPPPGRGTRIHSNGIEILDQSYNANPISTAGALRELARENGGRRYALLGEMLELGAAGPELHAGLAPACVGLNGIWLVGRGMLALARKLPAKLLLGWRESADQELREEIDSRLQPGDILLVKGSNRVFWQQSFVAELDRLLRRGF